jgi:hypothetical protein
VTISAADFNALPRVTATEIAERTYAASVARRSAKAASLLPDPRALYRPTIDAQALRSHAERAFDAHELAEVPRSDRDLASAAIAGCIDALFPPADMEILARYGAAAATDLIHVLLADRRNFDLAMDPRLLPSGANMYEARMESDGRRPVPDLTLPLFDRIVELRLERKSLVVLFGWPAAFKRHHERWPRWKEIEQHWPILGRYLAGRREDERA